MYYHNYLTKLLIKYMFVFITTIFLSASYSLQDRKDFKTQIANANGKGNVCIARFESNGEPLYYSCPRPNESEKKSYCCFLDKCCDYKEFQKQTEQQFKLRQAANFGILDKDIIGKVLKWVLGFVLFIIILIIGCCALLWMSCRKKKLFTGGLFNSPLPAQPPGPSPYAPPTQPYVAYQWPPETASQPPPAYPSYPPYPSGNIQPQQQPFNPTFK